MNRDDFSIPANGAIAIIRCSIAFLLFQLAIAVFYLLHYFQTAGIPLNHRLMGVLISCTSAAFY